MQILIELKNLISAVKGNKIFRKFWDIQTGTHENLKGVSRYRKIFLVFVCFV